MKKKKYLLKSVVSKNNTIYSVNTLLNAKQDPGSQNEWDTVMTRIS
jgi:hypothetical protein